MAPASLLIAIIQARMGITLCDVGPRDGLQNDRGDARARGAGRAVRAAGRDRAAARRGRELRPPAAACRRWPARRTCFAALARRTGRTLVGARAQPPRASTAPLAAGADEIHVAYPVTETFAQRNQNMTVEEAARRPRRRSIAAAHDAGPARHRDAGRRVRLPVRGQRRSRAWWSSTPAAWPPPAPTRSCSRTRSASACPRQVRRLLPAAQAAAGDMPVGLHLHNTRNTGYANAYAGLEHGVTLFDASVGGLGGCPFAPRATGNIATEDLVYLLEGEGVDTGVDLDGADRRRGVAVRRARPRAARPRAPRRPLPAGRERTPDSPAARRRTSASHVEQRRVVGVGPAVADRLARRRPARSPCWSASTTVARTQPEVVAPHTTSAVAAGRASRASGVPKKADANAFDEHRLAVAAAEPLVDLDPRATRAAAPRSAGTLRRNTAAARSRAAS